MARTTKSHLEHHGQDQSFDIFDEGSPLLKEKHLRAPAAAQDNGLRELSEAMSQVQLASPTACPSKPVASLVKSPQRELMQSEAKTRVLRRSARLQRAHVDSELFEPLVPVPEETSSILESENTVKLPTVNPIKTCQTTPTDDAAERKSVLERQVEKHLAGQFDWIMTYPAEASAGQDGHSGGARRSEMAVEPRLYGCNALPGRRGYGCQGSTESPTEKTVTLLATPLTQQMCNSLSKTGCQDLNGIGTGTTQPSQLRPPPYTGTPFKIPEVITMIERAVSPTPSFVSERSSSFMDVSSQAGSLSVPRIEDSLEKIDQLEDELEAVQQLTSPHPLMPAIDRSIDTIAPAVKDTVASSPRASKRASVAGCSATVRLQPSQKERPALRRSASLTLRDKKGSPDGRGVEAGISRGQAFLARLSTPKHPIKSAKPLTVPRFELPGEAVARRLKEQREARRAQQEEAQRAQASTSKPRMQKFPTRPTFELPGEAISRRKREEQEAKLRAEEAEARRRREFKARPVWHGKGPIPTPRETLTNRSRQSKPTPGGGADADERVKCAAVSAGGSSSGSSSMSNSPRSRGIISAAALADDDRATSTLTSHTRGKRESVFLEEMAMQKQRAKVAKDYSDEGQSKGIQERESEASMAREQAAEPGSTASRQWAERKRRQLSAAQPAKESQDAH